MKFAAHSRQHPARICGDERVQPVRQDSYARAAFVALEPLRLEFHRRLDAARHQALELSNPH